MTATLPDYEDVTKAAFRLEGVAHRTPVLRSSTLDARLGAQVFSSAKISSGLVPSNFVVATTPLLR